MKAVRFAYWFGAAADAFWAVALLVPTVYGRMTGIEQFAPDSTVRSIMAVGGVLMACWTILLLWAVKEPIGRRFIILLTALVVFGMLVIQLAGYVRRDPPSVWIVLKTVALLGSMITSFVLAKRLDVWTVGKGT